MSAVAYNADHRRERERWKRLIAGGSVHCARCGRLIDPEDPFWDLGHDDVLRDGSTWGPEHRRCNRGAPSKRRARVRRQQYWSMEW